MGQTLVADYSFAHPDPARVKAAGYVGVMRYLSPDPAKNLSPAELLALHALDLGVGLVWEAGATDELGAAPVGKSEAAAATSLALALGFPLDRPIFFAADFAASGGQLADVAAYLDAARTQTRYPIGVYGSATTVDTMLAEGVCSWGWQTSAWSSGIVSARAELYQRQTPVLTIAGAPPGSWDENVALRPDWGGWYPAAQAVVNVMAPTSTWQKRAPVPLPAPPAGPEPPGRNPWCPLDVDGLFGPLTARALQWAVHIDPQDGLFGPVSIQALQGHLFVTEDGIMGPQTVRALQARVGAVQDGIEGPQTVSALQRALNAGWF
jgi:Rv2525c-like, glycoside hydrolase-like domain